MILVVGHAGMLGRTLMRRWAATATGVDRESIDITEPDSIAACLDRVRPVTLVNCAAFTAVDRCEAEEALATRINADGAGNLARACATRGIRLLHISTDYVFAGDLDRPYREDDRPDPRTAYGRGKLAGELAIAAAGGDWCILRTAWLYGPGGPSFVHAMRKVLADGAAPAAPVVDDQHGNPTSTDALAGCIEAVLQAPTPRSIVHASCEGETTWYGFAREIARLWSLPRAIRPCPTSEFPRPAPRPANSRLEKSALAGLGLPPMPTWQQALANYRHDHGDG